MKRRSYRQHAPRLAALMLIPIIAHTILGMSNAKKVLIDDRLEPFVVLVPGPSFLIFRNGECSFATRTG